MTFNDVVSRLTFARAKMLYKLKLVLVHRRECSCNPRGVYSAVPARQITLTKGRVAKNRRRCLGLE